MILFNDNFLIHQGNGYIARPTLKGLLHEIAPDLSDKDLEAAVDEIDEDGSGKIEFEGGQIAITFSILLILLNIWLSHNFPLLMKHLTFRILGTDGRWLKCSFILNVERTVAFIITIFYIIECFRHN